MHLYGHLGNCTLETIIIMMNLPDLQIGWCTASCVFSMDTGVGDTAHSYAYDGGRVRRWNVATSPYGQAWLPGDVIGSCIDLDKGTLEYYRYVIIKYYIYTPIDNSRHYCYNVLNRSA
jgi:hypothetical protein